MPPLDPSRALSFTVGVLKRGGGGDIRCPSGLQPFGIYGLCIVEGAVCTLWVRVGTIIFVRHHTYFFVLVGAFRLSFFFAAVTAEVLRGADW